MTRPADPGAERVEQRGDDRVERRGHREQHRVRAEVLVLGVAAPEAGRAVDGDEAVHVAAGRGARSAGTSPARHAAHCAARLEHLDRDPVADGDAPALRRRAARSPR